MLAVARAVPTLRVLGVLAVLVEPKVIAAVLPESVCDEVAFTMPPGERTEMDGKPCRSNFPRWTESD